MASALADEEALAKQENGERVFLVKPTGSGESKENIHKKYLVAAYYVLDTMIDLGFCCAKIQGKALGPDSCPGLIP